MTERHVADLYLHPNRLVALRVTGQDLADLWAYLQTVPPSATPSMPHEIGSIALCESGRLLVALQTDVHFLDLSSGQLTPLVHITHPADRMRLNDGRTDRAGRFCLGSLVLGRHEPHGVLYQLDAAGRVKELDRGICVSNATCFSPDGRWLAWTNMARATYEADRQVIHDTNILANDLVKEVYLGHEFRL